MPHRGRRPYEPSSSEVVDEKKKMKKKV